MKKTLTFITLGMTLFATAAVVAAPMKIQVRLLIAPDQTLPGLSVPLNLHVTNGSAAVHLGSSLRVRATSPDGQSFFADWSEGVDSDDLELGVTDEEDATFTLPANATVDLAVPALDLSRPSWALDQRLLALPGEWRLQVFVYTDDPSNPVAISNVAKLTIATPSGRDVAVWEAIRRREYSRIAEHVLAERPESPYFPYLAPAIARRSTAEKIAIIRSAIDGHPNSPAVPSLRYALASYYGAEADRVFFEEHDLEKAVGLADKGRAELTAMKNGKDPWSKLKGKARLGDFPSREYFLDLQRLQREKGNRKQ